MTRSERQASGPASPSAATAEALLRQAERAVSAALAERWPQRPVRLGPAVTGGSNVVFRAEVGERVLCATYNPFGSPLASLVAGAGGESQAVLDARRAHAGRADGPLAREAEQGELLYVYGGIRVPDPVGTSGGVLLTSWVDGPSLARRLLTEREATAGLLSGLFADLGELHADPAEPLRRAARRTAAGAVPPLLARALTGGPDRWLGDCAAAGWAEAGEVAELRALGLRVVARLGRLGHRLDPEVLTRAGVCFGGLSPRHVLYPTPSSRPVLVSPNLGAGGEVVDAGTLLGRLHLLLTATRPAARTVTDVVDGVEAWIRGRLAAVLTMWAADVLNVLGGALSVPPGVLPLPPATVAATRRAVEVLTAVDAFTGALLQRGADPAMNLALTALASTSNGTDRGNADEAAPATDIPKCTTDGPTAER